MLRVIFAAGIAALSLGNAGAGPLFTELAYTAAGDSNQMYGQLSVLGEWSSNLGVLTNFPTGIPPVTATAAAAPGSAMSSLIDPTVGTGSAAAALQMPLGIMRTDVIAGGGAAGAMGAQAEATYTDTLSWQIAGANAGSVNFVNFSFTLDGNLTLLGNAHGTTSITIDFGNGRLIESIFDGPDNQAAANCGFGVTTAPCLFINTPANWASSSFSSNTPTLIVFNATYELDGASGTLPISFDLHDIIQSAGGTLEMDYSHTATIGLMGPAGFSFTTNSGDFLTGAGSTVPEPGTCGAVAGALGALIWMRRRGGVVRLRR